MNGHALWQNSNPDQAKRLPSDLTRLMRIEESRELRENVDSVNPTLFKTKER